MAATSVSVSRNILSYLLPLQETLQDQQVGLTQVPLKLLPLCWDLEYVRFCVRPLTVDFLLAVALQVS